MNIRLRPWLLTFTIATLVLALRDLSNAQQTATQPAVGQAQISATKAASAMIPYSADEIRETTQTLADGTQVTHKRLTKIFRDSEGRTRTEAYVTESGSSQASSDSPIFIDIVDRVAGVRYSLNPHNHTAHRMSLTPPQAARLPQKAANPAPASAQRPAATAEDLGQQEIEGINTHGYRMTRTVPVGADGNDRPIMITEEQWVSPELHRIVLEDVHDPLRGETILRLTNIVREEPSPDLFQVPADYTITEEQPVRAGIAPSE
jgi:hypothetical protein